MWQWLVSEWVSEAKTKTFPKLQSTSQSGFNQSESKQGLNFAVCRWWEWRTISRQRMELTIPSSTSTRCAGRQWHWVVKGGWFAYTVPMLTILMLVSIHSKIETGTVTVTVSPINTGDQWKATSSKHTKGSTNKYDAANLQTYTLSKARITGLTTHDSCHWTLI